VQYRQLISQGDRLFHLDAARCLPRDTLHEYTMYIQYNKIKPVVGGGRRRGVRPSPLILKLRGGGSKSLKKAILKQVVVC
jgi:hypothetical protein